MRHLGRRSPAVRAFAVIFTAYLVIASGRALIPGLCATLAGVEHDQAICVSPDHPCCSPDQTNEKSGDSIVAPPTHCAFCDLVHAAARSETVPVIDAIAGVETLVAAAHDVYVPNLAGTGAYLRRGPPMA